MKPNISVLNAIMRITCGLTALAWATSRLARRPHRMSFLMVAMMGAMKVGEGIYRYCPVTDFVKQNANNNEKEKGKSSSDHKSEHRSSDHDE
ncbi:MAG TPA: DUF2892 domain-containing protein [Bacillales bacterium]|nr:DUF2892 domain-containing protein [Bacillales bacterium]